MRLSSGSRCWVVWCPALPQPCWLARWPCLLKCVCAFTLYRPGRLMAFQLLPSFPPQASPSISPVGDPAEGSLTEPQAPDASFLHVIPATPICGQTMGLVMGWTAWAPVTCSLPVDNTNHGGSQIYLALRRQQWYHQQQDGGGLVVPGLG